MSATSVPDATPRTAGLRRWWPVAAVVVVAGVAVLVWVLNTDRRRLYLEFEPAAVVVALGVAVVGTVLLLRLVRRRAADRAAREHRKVLAAVDAGHRQERLHLLSRLDHELKNPLTALRLGLSGLQGADPEAVRAVGSQVDRLSGLTRDLRKLAALETGPLDLVPVDVGVLLQEVVGDVDGFDEQVQVELALPRGPFPLPPVRGDRDLLQAAVMNLVVNAVKFSEPGGLVEVRAREEPGPPHRVVIEVADTGIGIPPEELDLVWQELARGRQAHGRPGTGIGLALVQIVVRRHGGRTGLRSRVGAGTVVTVELPC